MIALFLILGATFSQEVLGSLGKYEVQARKESLYTMGFLSIFGGALFLVLGIALGADFRFSAASLPFLLPRLVLEIVQVEVSLRALVRADRSTFTFFRLLTIPALLVADLLIGYRLGSGQIVGILLVASALSLLLARNRSSRRSLGLVIWCALNAAATISIYKYDITHFNSVAAEQLVVYVLLLIYLTTAAIIFGHQNPWHYLVKRAPEAQWISGGAGAVLQAFAYSLAPASVIIAFDRAFSVMWSIISGRMIFRERHLTIKIAALALVSIGLTLLLPALR